jgi:hypothetical protein
MSAETRTKNVAHYVIARSPANRLGATKLNKAMWIADILAYTTLGRTITGQKTYKKLQHGPVPNGIVTYLDELIAERKIVKRVAPTPKGNRHEYIWLSEPDVTIFSKEEIDLLNRAISYVCYRHTAESISDLTHDPLWEQTEMGDQISVAAATVTPSAAGPKQREWALRQIAERV